MRSLEALVVATIVTVGAVRALADAPVDAGVSDAPSGPSVDAPPGDAQATPSVPSEADKAAAEAAAAEQAAADKAAADKAAADKAAADKAAADKAAADKAAADKAAAEKAAADKAAADKAAADKAAADKNGGATAFDGGYTDEVETTAPRFVTNDPYDARPLVSGALNLGFGVGRAADQVAGLMVGGAGLRIGPSRLFAELSGGTGLSHLDIAVGADVAWGNRKYHGLAVRAGYARGSRVREDVAFHELRADVGLASLEGFSWLSGRVRVDDMRGVDAFFFVIEIERVR